MMDIMFVEDYDGVTDLRLKDKNRLNKFGSTIIPVTPEAHYQLSEAGQWCGSRTLDDYYIWTGSGAYASWQKKWLDSFGCVLQTMYPWLLNLDMHITHHCAFMLLSLADVFIRRAKQLEVVLNEHRPQRIYFVTSKRRVDNEDTFDGELRFWYGPSVFYKLFISSSWFDAVHKEVIYVDADTVPNIRSYKDNEMLRKMYFYFKTFACPVPIWLSRWFRWNDNKRTDVKFCFANMIPDRMREAKLDGCKVVSMPVLDRADGNLSSRQVILSSKDRNDVYTRIADFTDINLSVVYDVLGSRLDYFMNHMVRHIIDYAMEYATYFGKNSFDCVIYNNRTNARLFGSLIGANMVGTKTAYFEHGWDAYALWNRVLDRIQPFDYYKSFSNEERNYYETLQANDGGNDSKCKFL